MASETIWVDLKAAAEGIGVKQNPNLLLRWEENVKGYSALKVQPLAKEFKVKISGYCSSMPFSLKKQLWNLMRWAKSEPPTE